MRKVFVVISFVLCIYLLSCASQYKEEAETQPSELQKYAMRIKEGNELMRKQQYKQAINRFQDAIAINEERAEAHNLLGICYFQLSEYPEAKNAFHKALGLDKSFAQAHNNLGTVYYVESNYEEAIKEFNETVRLNPEIASAYHNMGNIFLVQNQLDKAIEYYKKAFKADPNYITSSHTITTTKGYTEGKGETEYSYACVLASAGKTDQALDYLKKAVDKGFSDWNRMKNDPDLQGLKDNPRFQKLIKGK